MRVELVGAVDKLFETNRSVLADRALRAMLVRVDAAALAYIDSIDTNTRPLFDRIHRLIVHEFPDVDVGVSYQMPVYRRAGRSLNVGAWKHGVSIYGWPDQPALSILERHPQLSSGKGTLRITHEVADDIRDGELVELVRSALGDGNAECP